MGSLLETLFGCRLDDFVAETWPERPRHAGGPVARFGELATHPALADVPTLLRAHRGPAQLLVHTAEGTAHRAIDAETAIARFEAGEVMDLRDVQRWLPPVRAWIDRFHDELALAHATRASYCHAFVSPAGTGVGKHFDNREVFAVQLRGRKRWRVAPNDVLPLPLMPHNVGNPVHPLNVGATGELNDPAMPDDAATYVLEPGSVLFVPRGWWHATEALEDSCSLSFGFRAPTWAEVFAERLTATLADVPAWRWPAFDVRAARPPGTEDFVRSMHRALHALAARKPPGPA